MTSLKLWILLLTGTAFLAGSAGGVLAGHGLAPEPPRPRPYAAYEELLLARFEIADDRARALRAILELYHRDVEELRSRHMGELEPELLRAGATCRDRIQRYVLTESQRAALADVGVQGMDAFPLSLPPAAPGRN